MKTKLKSHLFGIALNATNVAQATFILAWVLELISLGRMSGMVLLAILLSAILDANKP